MQNTLFGYPVIEVEAEPLEGEPIILGSFESYSEIDNCPKCGNKGYYVTIEGGDFYCLHCMENVGKITDNVEPGTIFVNGKALGMGIRIGKYEGPSNRSRNGNV